MIVKMTRLQKYQHRRRHAIIYPDYPLDGIDIPIIVAVTYVMEDDEVWHLSPNGPKCEVVGQYPDDINVESIVGDGEALTPEQETAIRAWMEGNVDEWADLVGEA